MRDSIELVSIIVPAYNAEKTIHNTIDSVLNQSYKEWELLIINDGSTDNTEKVCSNFKDIRIKIINQTNQGLSAARNTGLRNSKGDYICFVDSDDWISPEYISTLYSSLNKENSDIAVCGIKMIKNASVDIISVKNNCSFENLFGNRDFLVLFETGLLNSSCNKLYKKEIIVKESLLFRNLALVEDIEFNIHYFQYTQKISIVKDALYNYELNNSQLTLKASEEMFINYINIHDLLLKLVDTKNILYINKFVYHQYFSIMLRFIAKVSKNELSKRITFNLLDKYMRTYQVRIAFDDFIPLCLGEKLIYELIKHRFFFVVLLYMKFTQH